MKNSKVLWLPTKEIVRQQKVYLLKTSSHVFGRGNTTLVEKQQSFIRFYMLPNTFWRILDDSNKIFHA